MIYKYKKYKDIEAFVKNKPKSKKKEEYTICSECKGIDFVHMEYTDKCFGCLFCVLEDEGMLKKFKEKWGENFISEYSKKAFTGEIAQLPNAGKILKNPIKNLQDFTGINETKNIQPWAGGILNHVCSKDNRIGMEVPVFNMNYNRNGRLDICSMSEDYLLIMESKISLDEALKDERFIEQQEKYTVEIEKCVTHYKYLTLFGGRETDLLPASHKQCTGNIGRKTERFYSMVENYGIRFISANAIWCMCCKYLSLGKQYAWDTFLISLFDDINCVGLISAGKILKRGSEYIVQSID